jgi:predicted nucleic acid binding AN1-type Zn finger protein
MPDIFKTRYSRCSHVHVSGRRCPQMFPKSGNLGRPKECTLHRGRSPAACVECLSMKSAFVPPKGW